MADQSPLLAAKSNQQGGSPCASGSGSGGGGARVAVFVALVVLLGATLGQIYWASSHGGRHGFAYLADGAYEHLVIARDLANCCSSHPTTSVAGQTTSAVASGQPAQSTPLAMSASPGWSLLLAGLLRTPALSDGPGRNADEIALVPLVLNLAAAALLVLIVGHLVRRELRSWLWMFLLLMVMGVLMPLPLVVMVGMEHMLHACVVLLLVAAGIAAVQDGYSSVGWVVSAMILAAMGVALRYESFAVLVALLLLGWIQGHGVRGLFPVAAGLGVVIAVGVYLMGHGGTIAPAPMMVHCYGFLQSKLQGTCSHGPQVLNAALVSLPGALLLIAAALLAANRAGMHSLDRLTRERAGWLFVFVFVALAHLLVGPTSEYRYKAYLLPLGAVAIGRTIAAAACDGERCVRPRGNRLIVALCLLPILVVAAVHMQIVAMGGEMVRDALVRERMAASFVRTYFPTGPVVTNQAGVLRYETQARVVDPWWMSLTSRWNKAYSGEVFEQQVSDAQVVLLKGIERWQDVPSDWKLIGGWNRIGWWNGPSKGLASNSAVRVYAVSAESADVVKMALQRASQATDARADVEYWFADQQSASAPATQSAVLYDGAANRLVRATRRPACEASCHWTTGADKNWE